MAFPATDRRVDLPTLIAIAVVCNVGATIVHEALGHGLAALAFGAHVNHVSSVDLRYDDPTLPAVPKRIVAAAGPLANLVTGAIVLAVARRWTPRRTATRFFLWLFGTVNLLSFGGYAMALSFAPYGDMHQLVLGLPHPTAIKIGLTAAGAAVSFFALFNAARTLAPWIADPRDRRGRALELTLIPYLTMGIVATTAGALNPDSPLLILISAASASFGGNAFIVWIPAWLRASRIAAGPSIGIARSRGWIAVGIVTLLFLYAGLAPGLPR